MLPCLTLKAGREKSVLNRHPWIFSGAVAAWPECSDGDLVRVEAAGGEVLGGGYINRRSSICVRLLCFDGGDPLEALRLNLRRAIRRRQALTPPGVNAVRLVNSEGDDIPGLIVDRYGDVLVLQCGTLGIEKLKDLIVGFLVEELKPLAVYEKSNLPVRREEGLEPQSGWLCGHLQGQVTVKEDECLYLVDIQEGQKTGFFLDQREMRSLVRRLASGRRVLNCFCYSGAFSVCAALGGAARVKSIDSSKAALELARQNFVLNGIDADSHDFEAADVLAALPQEKEKYDFIVLDPPAFAKKRAHINQAARAYGELNREALRLLSPGGLLLSCSCSYYMEERLFQQILFQSAVHSGRSARIVQKHRQAFDHPVNICHPEGSYLKSFLLEVE